MTYEPLKETGQCWSCGDKGVQLHTDPLCPDEGSDKPIKICGDCAIRRNTTLDQYNLLGAAFQPHHLNDSVRDNPDYRGQYVTIGDPPMPEPV